LGRREWSLKVVISLRTSRDVAQCAAILVSVSKIAFTPQLLSLRKKDASLTRNPCKHARLCTTGLWAARTRDDRCSGAFILSHSLLPCHA